MNLDIRDRKKNCTRALDSSVYFTTYKSLTICYFTIFKYLFTGRNQLFRQRRGHSGQCLRQGDTGLDQGHWRALDLENGRIHIASAGWCFGTWILWLSIHWECHNANWRTHIFQRGRLKPPTSSGFALVFPRGAPFQVVSLSGISWAGFYLASSSIRNPLRNRRASPALG